MALLKLSEAEDYVLTALRDRDADSYEKADRLNAINTCLWEFCRVSRWLRKIATVKFKTGFNTFDMTDAGVNDQATVDEFTADRIYTVYLSDDFDEVSIRDIDTLLQLIRNASPGFTAEKPSRIAFQTRTQGLIYPAAEADINATFVYGPEHRTLTGDDDLIDVPRDIILPALFFGVPALLRHAGREDLAADPMWRTFIAMAIDARSKGADPGEPGDDIDRSVMA